MKLKISWMYGLLLLGALLFAHGKAQSAPRVPNTVLEEIENMQRYGRRVRLSKKQMPGMPKIGWREYKDDKGKVAERRYEKISFQSAPESGPVPGFVPDWACAASGALNLYLGTYLYYRVLDAPRANYIDFEARIHRPQRVETKRASAIRRQLKSLEKPLLYSFFSNGILAPQTSKGKSEDKKKRFITGTWGRYVHRMQCTKATPFSAFFDTINGTKELMDRIGPSIRVVWIELSVRVNEKGVPVSRPAPFARIIAFETKQYLYLVEQRATWGSITQGGDEEENLIPIDTGDW